MKIKIYEKRMALIASVVISILSVIWFLTGKFDMEPLITSIGSIFSAYCQRNNWKIERVNAVLANPPSQAPQALGMVMDFAIQEYILRVKPLVCPQNYWRIGFKMNSQSLIPIDSHLNLTMVLFSVEQDGNVLSMSFHNDQGLPETIQKQRLLSNYNMEEFEIVVKKGHYSTIFHIYKDGHKIGDFTVRDQYRYGRVITWADNHNYRIQAELIIIP